ncbi:hypothetical protein BO71DRAFT_60677 [Aspergillus ellipticus CBS 707.79]|uniref:Reverse transcriptase domain-containing protein n=1 Tax=Aspergillus ellipticus CBS 707.79 TaxID=1448320 RepID=A0A319D1A7_9EURO|nr:hypothetical protein BO71DRAFT_60677 [Aspergillus ellipticus CBS 707.79]
MQQASDPDLTGMPQGSPLTEIFYLFYNVDFMTRGSQDMDTDNIGYIDLYLFRLRGSSSSFYFLDSTLS